MPALYEGLIQSLDKRWIVGRYSARRRPPSARELRVMAHLLENVSKQRPLEVDQMPSKKPEAKKETAQANAGLADACNMVFLAGEIQSKISVKDKRGFFLIDGGDDSKWIPCTIFDEKDLLSQLELYEKGDYIKIVGYVRIWSRKDKETDEWQNNTEIRITQIKSKPPENRHPRRETPISDDDIPF